MARKADKTANGHGVSQADRMAEVTHIDGAEVLIDPGTLTGDLRDLILDTLQHEQAKRPWSERAEHDQRDTVARVEQAVTAWVRRAVELIVANGRQTIRATLEQVTVKEGIKATLTLSKFDAQRHALMDATGASVLVVVADPAAFEGEREAVAIVPDQGTLGAAMVEHADTGVI